MLKNYIAVSIASLFALVIITVAGLTTFDNLKQLFNKEIISGKITKVNLLNNYPKNGGGNLNAFEFKIDSKNEKLFLTPYERINYNIKIGDIITFKKLYIGNTNSKILSINGQTIDTFYDLFDLLMLVLCIASILICFFYFKINKAKKYINNTEEYRRATRRRKR